MFAGGGPQIELRFDAYILAGGRSREHDGGSSSLVSDEEPRVSVEDPGAKGALELVATNAAARRSRVVRAATGLMSAIAVLAGAYRAMCVQDRLGTTDARWAA
jgi:hypothetical protein